MDADRWTAKWIWTGGDAHAYNQAVVFRRSFSCAQAPERATLRFSADSVARVSINGHWVADGPCRGWPWAYYYDELDLAPHLRPGENTVEAVVRYHGVGTFHQIPQRAGFLAQVTIDGCVICATDESWQCAVLAAWRRQTPKSCIQMGPCEWHDARRTSEPWANALPFAEADRGPWGQLRRRDVALAGRFPVRAPDPVALAVVRADQPEAWAVPVTQLCHPGLVLTNIHTSRTFGLATVLHAESDVTIPIDTRDWTFACNGQPAGEALVLRRGPNPVLAMVRQLFKNTFDAVLTELAAPGVRAENPLDPTHAFPWAAVVPPQFEWMEDDLWWFSPARPDREALKAAYAEFSHDAAARTASVHDLRRWLETVPSRVAQRDEIAWVDPHAAFKRREPIEIRPPDSGPGAFPIQLKPHAKGDLELQFDLGDQYSGYHDFDVEAPEGTVLDLFVVEHVDDDGRVQHTGDARNGMRYVCRGGRQQFRSLLKRSGRHLFLTARGAAGPVTLHSLGLTETRYPARKVGRFRCSDDRLNRLFDAAERTMELSMDDVYVDSLYEQTLWIGDLRTEALYGMWHFDARDLTLRSLRIGAQSLERLPLVAAQAPSSWDCILPAWSFLWGIAVWEYYEYSGDAGAISELWPAVRRNLGSAQTYLNDRGLMDAPFWNLLDWSGSDIGHSCVIHNSMLLCGAIKTALRCAELLGHKDDTRWLRTFQRRVSNGVESAYDRDRLAYVDALRVDGKPSRLSVHPQFLALLHDLAPADRRRHLLDLVLRPPDGMARVASPFMLHFVYETLEKCGQAHAIADRMRRDYAPIIDARATTLWETLPNSRTIPGDWPTRSRCHGWSAAPLYYLPRTVLGIRSTSPGGRSFEIRPCLGDLQWAEGAVATPFGPLQVHARRDGTSVHVNYQLPDPAMAITVSRGEDSGASCYSKIVVTNSGSAGGRSTV